MSCAINEQRQYDRTLTTFPEIATAVWLFEPTAARLRERQQRELLGQSVVIHSAYKTLLHYALEQAVFEHAKSATIHYPVVEGDEAMRFRLECYPLQSMFTDCDMQFVPAEFSADFNGHLLPYYKMTIDDGSEAEPTTLKVPVPVRWQEKPTGKVLAACGWVQTADHPEGMWLSTEFEKIYSDAYELMLSMPLTPLDDQSPSGPFFDRLNIRIDLPAAIDTRLPMADEQISLAEALHEDLYFSALEVFQLRLDLPKGSRALQPGQVLPFIQQAEQPALSISTGAECPVFEAAEFSGTPQLHDAGHWLTPKQIMAHLDKIGGQAFGVNSRRGRNVPGRRVSGKSGVNLAISSGQHANESSGIVGGLRAAHALAAAGELNFTICPLNNPDGYVAFRELCQTNPCHMHHAARYTASGNDLAYTDDYEAEIYPAAIAQLPATVHLNLHGYPAHEWTRPLSGYIPAGFAQYTLPKGFFIICHYQPAYEAMAMAILNVATQAVADHSEQIRQNQAMLTAYRDNVGKLNFEIAHDAVPFVTKASPDMPYPIEIVTEAPDETVYGETFRIAHESHFRVVMAIADYLLRNQQD